MNKLEFLTQWFGPNDRSLGIPYQTRIVHALQIMPHMAQWSYPVYLSVNPYTPEGKIAFIEKLYFDFDSLDLSLAWRDCLSFTNKIRATWGIDALLVRSGHKGYNAYIWLKTPYSGEHPGSVTQEELKDKYGELQRRLIGRDAYPTLDKHVIGDIRRISRVPLSFHPATGNLVVPVNTRDEPYNFPDDFIVHHKLYGIDPFGYTYTPQRVPSRLASATTIHIPTKTTDLRPCMQAVMDASSVHDPAHKLKVSLVAELHEKGYSENEIVSFFSNMSGFNDAIARGQVRSVVGNYKPFRCTTIRSLGGCIGSSCRFYRLEFYMEEKDRLNELRARARHLIGLIDAMNANNKPARGPMWSRRKEKENPKSTENSPWLPIKWQPWEGWVYEQQHSPMHPNTRDMKNELETRLNAISEELSTLERKNRKSVLSSVRQIRLKESA